MLKIAIVTNLIAPHRAPIYSQIGRRFGVHLHVFLCGASQGNPHEDSMFADFDVTLLGAPQVPFDDHEFNFNLDVIPKLRAFVPKVIVTDGFSPRQRYAFLYALAMNIPHVAMTEETCEPDKALGWVAKAMRSFMHAHSKAFVSASQGGQALFDQYGITSDRCFTSCLCVDNEKFGISDQGQKKQFDFIFRGRIESVKNPIFALEVCVQLAKRLRRKIRILYVGRGELEEDVQSAARLFPGLIEVELCSTATQDQLPDLYRSAKLLLLPSSWDAWGVVTNEACAAGLPVIVSPFAGVANELVRDGENGFICELDAKLWADKAEYLLTHPESYRIFSERSQSLVRQYNYESAAVGLVAAAQFAISPAAKKPMKNSIKSKPRVVIVERQLIKYRVGF